LKRNEKRSRIAPRKCKSIGSDSGVPTQLITKPQDRLSMSRLMAHMLHCEAKDVTLKWMFDHVKNYLICGALLWVGTHELIKHSPSVVEAVVAKAGSLVLMFSAFVLFALNICHGITGYSKIRNLGNVGKFAYLTAGLLVFFAAQVLLTSSKGSG
jgi:hypothetical protein